PEPGRRRREPRVHPGGQRAHRPRARLHPRRRPDPGDGPGRPAGRRRRLRVRRGRRRGPGPVVHQLLPGLAGGRSPPPHLAGGRGPRRRLTPAVLAVVDARARRDTALEGREPPFPPRSKTQPGGATVMRMYVAGEWIDKPETIPVENPYDRSVIDT